MKGHCRNVPLNLNVCNWNIKLLQSNLPCVWPLKKSCCSLAGTKMDSKGLKSSTTTSASSLSPLLAGVYEHMLSALSRQSDFYLQIFSVGLLTVRLAPSQITC